MNRRPGIQSYGPISAEIDADRYPSVNALPGDAMRQFFKFVDSPGKTSVGKMDKKWLREQFT